MVNQFTNMIGRTMRSGQGKVGEDIMIFHSDDGWQFSFYHSQDCCESVSIEDICGDMEDLIGSPILIAEEVSSQEREERLTRMSNLATFNVADLEKEQDACLRGEPMIGHALPTVDADSYTWTFYRFATAKGYVTVRWLGVSNGYYSESVTFDETRP
jgi:hypothetical protein